RRGAAVEEAGRARGPRAPAAGATRGCQYAKRACAESVERGQAKTGGAAGRIGSGVAASDRYPSRAQTAGTAGATRSGGGRTDPGADAAARTRAAALLVRLFVRKLVRRRSRRGGGPMRGG